MDASGNDYLFSWQAYLASSEAEVFYLSVFAIPSMKEAKLIWTALWGVFGFVSVFLKFKFSNPNVKDCLNDIT